MGSMQPHPDVPADGQHAYLAVPLEGGTGTATANWQDEPPQRELLLFASSLCHLMYWWSGPQHRSLQQLRVDAAAPTPPPALIPPKEQNCATGKMADLQYFFDNGAEVTHAQARARAHTHTDILTQKPTVTHTGASMRARCREPAAREHALRLLVRQEPGWCLR
jgi:hypothetical protein